jgi:hypothetical protein
LQASHEAPQAVSQHRPSTQKELWHSVFWVHASPLGSPDGSEQVEVVRSHVERSTQPASPVHFVGQIALMPSQTYGLHEGSPWVPAGWMEQAPYEPGTSHASHSPLHELLQQ